MKAGVSSWRHDHSHVPSLISASRETLWLLHMWQLGHGRGSQARRWRSRGSPECGVPPARPPEPPSSQRWPPAALQGHRRAVYPEFRMQFPRHRIAPHIHIVGIATFVETVESSPNRIACDFCLGLVLLLAAGTPRGFPDLVCSAYRPNRLRTRIGYCDMDRL